MVWEIILVLVGITVLILGYVIPARKEKNEDAESFSKEQIQTMVAEEMESAKGQISDLVDETITYAMEKTERSMDRLSNEKMMAVSEYSDTVLEQINKNHEEVVFLYDMLNDKHENLKDTVAEASKAASEVKASIKEAEEFTPVSEMIERQIEDDSDSYVDKAAKKTKRKTDKDSQIKPVPVIKAVVPVTPPLADNEEEDESEGEALEEWDDFNNEIEDMDDEDNGPMISFNMRTPGSRNNNERILELHKAGKSNTAIAKELGLGIGEVKLVIDLFKKN